MIKKRTNVTLQRLRATLSSPRNLLILGSVLVLHMLVLLLGWLQIAPHTDRPPCAVCGRANTKPVKVLWQYKVEVMPYVKEKNIYYCQRHIHKAPEIVKKVPSPKDTVTRRYGIMAGAASLLLLMAAYTVMILEIDFLLLLGHPALLLIIFLFWGITADITCGILMALIFIFPVLSFYLWTKQEGRP